MDLSTATWGVVFGCSLGIMFALEYVTRGSILVSFFFKGHLIQAVALVVIAMLPA